MFHTVKEAYGFSKKHLLCNLQPTLYIELFSVKFTKVWKCFVQSVAEDWAVEAMPTFMFLKEGKIVDKVVGAKKEELQMTIAKHAAHAAA